MKSFKKKYQIFLPFSIREKIEEKNINNSPRDLIFFFYNSVREILDLIEKNSIDLLFTEEKIFNDIPFEKIKNINFGVVIIFSDKIKKHYFKNGKIFDLIAKDSLSKQFLKFTIEKNINNLKKIHENNELKKQIIKQEKNFVELHDIGISLSKGNDFDALIENIITKSMELTSADGGSLYLLEDQPKNTKGTKSDYFSNKRLHQKIIKNNSRRPNIDSKYNFDFDKESICWKVIFKGESILIDNFKKNTKVDHFILSDKVLEKRYNYKVKSILTVPIFNNEKMVMGVIQLVNRKRNFSTILENTESILENVVPFENQDLYFLESVASQASVAITNTNLIKSVHILFDGFINASVRAIESRDPTTSGHSSRVATLTLGLAETINQLNVGKFASENFNKDQLDEIRYASLLHDFGKIGVRERVLVKSKKLYPDEFKSLIERFHLISALKKIEFQKKQITHFLKNSREKSLDYLKVSNTELEKELFELSSIQKFIIEANEPTKLTDDGFKKLKKFAKKIFELPDGKANNYLSKNELSSLSIKKGSLNDLDRKEIESHVTHTFNFLKIIPWTKNLERVPEIAYAHHEKLNGKGYPRNLGSNEIPLESKMMTIADIYDALTAWDRPYKKAIPKERALDILFFEAKDNHIDKDLLDIFVNAKLYNLVERT